MESPRRHGGRRRAAQRYDLHATILRLCGSNHERFTVKFQGFDAKLTGVEPCKVVKEIFG